METVWRKTTHTLRIEIFFFFFFLTTRYYATFMFSLSSATNPNPVSGAWCSANSCLLSEQ